MTGPTPEGIPEPSPVETTPTPADTPELVPLAEAAEIAGVTVGALRKRYQGGDLERHYDPAGRVLLDLDAVRRLYPAASPTERGSVPAEPETPAGSILVPLEAWQQVLAQLGNLHQAGQDLAEARERAARAEERETFAQERRREAVAEVERLRSELDKAGKELEADDRIQSTPRRRWWQRGNG